MGSSVRTRLILVCLFLAASTGAQAQTITDWIEASCPECVERMDRETGAYILEKGEESLIGRAWLADNATKSIDVQYFIWSTDNIGILAAEQLLSAAERGVRVRVLVDDLLIDAEKRTLLLLSAQRLAPEAEIRPKTLSNFKPLKNRVGVELFVATTTECASDYKQGTQNN